MSDFLKGLVEGFREDVYPSVRNKMADVLLQPGGKDSHPSHKQHFHEGGNYSMTKNLAGIGLPPQIAANLTDAAYLGNEALTGVLAKAAGRPFFSDYGFRWKDVGINRQGQDRAMEELRAQEARRLAQTAGDARGILGLDEPREPR